MRRRSRAGLAGLLALSATVAGGAVTGVTSAAFSGQGSNGGNSYGAAPDFKPPSIDALAIGKTEGGRTGFIRQGGTYYVFASVSDPGNPSSGIASVTANVANVTTGQTSVAMAAGSYTAGGVSYNYRSASLTANAGLSAGAKTFSITADDTDGNGPTTTNGSVTVDNTAPSATDNQITNAAGGTSGRPGIGDVVTLTFSEPIDPESILAGWDGTSTDVTVRIANIGPTGDTLTIWNAANAAQLPAGSVVTGGNYVTANSVFGTGPSPSRMTLSGNVLTVTLGAYASGSLNTDANNRTSTWTPSAGAYDDAGNLCSTTPRAEGGAADRNF